MPLRFSVLFGLYSNESGSYVVRDELQRMLQACENGYVPDSIASLFSEVSKIRNCLLMLWITGNIWCAIVHSNNVQCNIAWDSMQQCA